MFSRSFCAIQMYSIGTFLIPRQSTDDTGCIAFILIKTAIFPLGVTLLSRAPCMFAQLRKSATITETPNLMGEWLDVHGRSS